MNIEAHKKAVKESLDELQDCIQKGIEKRQRTIGFHCSAAGVDLLEIYLHQQNLINPGAYIKHNWFTSLRKAKLKLLFDFPKKEEILKLLADIEAKRNILCYSKPQPAKTIEEAITLFNRLKREFEKMGVKI